MNEQIKINWYRCKVEKQLMSELLKTSDFRGFCQVVPQVVLFLTTGLVAYLAYRNIDGINWMYSVPLLLIALFAHGTFSTFLGLAGPVHELCHKTPFRTKVWNEFFLKLYSFISWSDYVWFRRSHVKHHQATVHADHDGEVVLPQKFDWQSIKFFASALICNPSAIFSHLWSWVRSARGNAADWKSKSEWIQKIVPESDPKLRLEHRNWARKVLFGHLLLVTLFIATGNWILIVIFTLGTFYAGWLGLLCGAPQHLGLTPNVPDFRLCCRTYTCCWLPAFLYWNMQYHVEHHMFPAVPFYNLPKLRQAIEHDLPSAPHGLWATWMEILPIVKRQNEDPSYFFLPQLPRGSGEEVDDTVLETEETDAQVA